MPSDTAGNPDQVSDQPQSDVLAGLQIDRATTAERISDALRAMILRGEIEPGTPLREIRVVSALGVSRNTVREALRLLAREGLVKHSLHRGVAVTELSDSDVADIFRVRRSLELDGVEASSNASSVQFDALEAAADVVAFAAEVQDWVGTMEADLQFHAGLVGFLQSNRLSDFFTGVLSELRLAFLVLDESEHRDGILRSIDEHRDIVRAIRAGDRRRGSALVHAHLTSSEQRLLRVIRAE